MKSSFIMSKNDDQNIFTYPDIAKDYDNYYKSETGKAVDSIEKGIFVNFLEKLPRGTLLELGCGTGHWTDFFSKQGFKVTAIDTSEKMLQIARRKNINNAIFQKADAAGLPYGDHSFPVIATITMLEFVSNTESVLDEIDRVLKPGGTLMMGCLNELSEMGKNKNKDKVFRNAHFFTPEEIKQMVSRFGHPEINQGVYFSPTFELLDGTKKQNTVHPAFMAVSVQKVPKQPS
jgi:ubiquinone/menaquinone biosynthesis C-methylase UbiE